jgi:hypothetical protein
VHRHPPPFRPHAHTSRLSRRRRGVGQGARPTPGPRNTTNSVQSARQPCSVRGETCPRATERAARGDAPVVHHRHFVVLSADLAQQHARDGGEVAAARSVLCENGLAPRHKSVEQRHGAAQSVAPEC